MTDRATSQADNIMPARRLAIWVQAVDVTARPYNIALLSLGGKAIVNTTQPDHVYIDMHADGGDVYYAFSPLTANTLDNTAVNAAGVALVQSTAMTAPMAAKIPSGATLSVRIERSADQWVQLKTGAGTATLRVYASSQPEV